MSSLQSLPSGECREVHFSGRVQGVGFRYTTRTIAARHPVTGFVQNLPDGRVLLMIEGQPPVLDEVLEQVRAELQRYIQNEQTQTRPATGQFVDFSIRH